MVERPFKYIVKARITEAYCPVIKENTVSIVPEVHVKGDLNLEYDESTGNITVWTNKENEELPTEVVASP